VHVDIVYMCVCFVNICVNVDIGQAKISYYVCCAYVCLCVYMFV